MLTGVIGLALQDLLGNVFGGLSLQLDHTIRVGDWIQLQEVIGRVVEIRWRSTSIETRAWEERRLRWFCDRPPRRAAAPA